MADGAARAAVAPPAVRGSRPELAEVFILAGLLVLLIRARPHGVVLMGILAAAALGLGTFFLSQRASEGAQVAGAGSVLFDILLFFIKAGSFVFGSGLGHRAIPLPRRRPASSTGSASASSPMQSRWR